MAIATTDRDSSVSVNKNIVNPSITDVSFNNNDSKVNSNQTKNTTEGKQFKAVTVRLSNWTYDTSKAVVWLGDRRIHISASSLTNGVTFKLAEELEVTNIDNKLYFTIYGDGTVTPTRDPKNPDTITLKI